MFGTQCAKFIKDRVPLGRLHVSILSDAHDEAAWKEKLKRPWRLRLSCSDNALHHHYKQHLALIPFTRLTASAREFFTETPAS